MKQTSEFIFKLADLLEEYDVALCSEPIEDTEDCTRVLFIKNNKKGDGSLISQERFTNNRCHSTAYEFRVRVDSMVKNSVFDGL